MLAPTPASMSDPQPSSTPPAGRSFTIKAIAAGLLAAVAITAGAAINNIMREWQTPLIGHYLPPAPLLLLIGLALVWNPLAGRWRHLRFSPGEMAVVFGLCLVCAWIPHGGFGRFFLRALALPATQIEAHPEWRHADTMGHLPAGTMPMDATPVAAPLRASIASERLRLTQGASELAGVDAAAYAAALDLASLVPPREFLGDQQLARTGAELAWQRLQGRDARASPAVGELLRAMPRTLALGESTPPAWSLAQRRLAAAVRADLPAAEKEYERVFPGFLNGLQSGDVVVRPADLPTAAWLPSLAFWLPLVICFAVASLMLALVVHRQWASHEQLAYPLATLASSLMGRPGENGLAPVFRSRLFWWGLVPVLCVHGLNFLAIQLPGALPSIPLQWSNSGVIKQMFPVTAQSGGAGGLASGGIYFSLIGLTYFIASEISLSVGISGAVLLLLSTQWYLASGTPLDGGSMRAGAYIGFAAMILFTGRHYYWSVLLAAIGRRRADVAGEQAWAARLFLLASAGFVAVLVGAFGMDWLPAVCFALTVLVLMLVVSRVVCETGLPFVQAGWAPAQMISTVLGFGAIGPASLVSMYLVGAAMFKETRESLLPFASTVFKIADNTGTPRLPLALVGGVAMVVALIAGIAASMWGMYNFGAGRDAFAQWPGADALDQATRGLNHLIETGRYAQSAAASGLGKLGQVEHTAIQLEDLGWMAFGLVAVICLALGRFRFTWFPLHPIIFVVMGTWVSARIWFSVLLGWAIKVAIVKFAGGKVYQDLKPLFIGLIVGELSMAIITVVHPWLWFAITGEMPPIMGMFPS
jgi:hypothetical protein